MINKDINKRLTVTLPVKMVSILKAYASDFGYVRISDVVRKIIDDSTLYKTYCVYDSKRNEWNRELEDKFLKIKS